MKKSYFDHTASNYMNLNNNNTHHLHQQQLLPHQQKGIMTDRTNNGSVQNITSRNLRNARITLERHTRQNRDGLLFKKRLASRIEDEEIAERDAFVERELDFDEKEYEEAYLEAMQRECELQTQHRQRRNKSNNSGAVALGNNQDSSSSAVAGNDECCGENDDVGYFDDEYDMEDPAELYEYHLMAQQQQQQATMMTTASSSGNIMINGGYHNDYEQSSSSSSSLPNHPLFSSIHRECETMANRNEQKEMFVAKMLEQDSAVCSSCTDMICKNNNGSSPDHQTRQRPYGDSSNNYSGSATSAAEETFVAVRYPGNRNVFED